MLTCRAADPGSGQSGKLFFVDPTRESGERIFTSLQGLYEGAKEVSVTDGSQLGGTFTAERAERFGLRSGEQRITIERAPH